MERGPVEKHVTYRF